MQRVSTALLALAAACGMNTTPDLVLREISRPVDSDGFCFRPVRSSRYNAPEIARRNPGSAKHRAWKVARRNNIRKA